MPVLTRPVAARPYPDGSEVAGAHAPHYRVVEAISQVWEEVLLGLGDGVLHPQDTAVVRVAVDYRHEVRVGPGEFEVTVARIGRTSVELAVLLHQDGPTAVDARVVLVHVNAARDAAVPFTDRQRAALATLAVPAAVTSLTGCPRRCAAGPRGRPVRSVPGVDTVVGTVEQIAVYPVRSLGGRAVREAYVDPGGLRGDRAHAVVEGATGEPVSARTTPQLAGVTATGDAVADTRELTAVLGRPVRLTAADAPHAAGAAVHLVSRQAVDRAAAGDVPEGCSADDPRANLLLALDDAPGDVTRDGADERAWVGRRLRVGEALLRVTRTPKHCLGVYAEVLTPGRVAVGDPVRLEGAAGGAAGSATG